MSDLVNVGLLGALNSVPDNFLTQLRPWLWLPRTCCWAQPCEKPCYFCLSSFIELLRPLLHPKFNKYRRRKTIEALRFIKRPGEASWSLWRFRREVPEHHFLRDLGWNKRLQEVFSLAWILFFLEVNHLDFSNQNLRLQRLERTC